MKCPHCGSENPDLARNCGRCGTAFTPLDEAETVNPAASTGRSISMPPGSWRSASGKLFTLELGAEFGPRYRIESRIGQGGMGSVYKAYDKDLDRTVALKLVRSDLMADTETMQRFKQELLLASKISHKNILRIHDLGDVEGIKFISMAYIEGEDLHHLLKREGRLTVDRSIALARQLCEALEAAHTKGVMHRDLKPQNVLIDAEGNAYVSDFGLAKSLEAGAAHLTQTGQFFGTPRYMSPEQVEGATLDYRSDIYALGLIFYEMVTGDVPFRGDSTLQMMYQRTKEPPKSPQLVNPDLPDYITRIILRCLQKDPARRYQTAREVLNDLDAERAPSRPWKVIGLGPLPPRRVLAAVAVLVVFLGGYLTVDRFFLRPPKRQSVSLKPIALAILPFRNASGDVALDWLGPSLAEMIRTDVGQSSHLRTVSSDRIHQVLKDLRLSANSELDSATRRRLAEFTSADKLLWGQYLKAGGRIRIDATIQDANGQGAVALKSEAPNEDELLVAVNQLARSIQQNLALSVDVVQELQAKPLSLSSKSIPALRDYNEGLRLARLGNHSEALKRFQAATEADSTFAISYSRLGQAYANLGYGREAEHESAEAVRLSENLSEQEQLLILATHARIVNDLGKAIEAYEKLAKALPGDPQIHFDLGGLYESKGSFDLARNHFAKALESDPKYVDALLGAGRVEIKRRNPQGSLEYLNRALSLTIELNNQEAKGNTLHAIGIAYKRLNKAEDALRYYRESLAIKRQSGDKRGMAASLSEIAQAEALLGQKDQVVASYQEALKLRREIGDHKGIGNTLIDLGSFYQNRGQYDEALKLYKESLQIQIEVGNENYEALCLSNIGNVHLSKGQYDDARTYFERALQLREKSQIAPDIASTLYDLADIAAKTGQYDQALERYMRALELWRNAGNKRGVAIASYGMGTLFEYQGRYGAALDAKEEALKIFQQLEDRGFWLAEVLSGRGNTLSLVGRYEEAQKDLDAALNLAREQQNNPLIAQILNFQGDRSFYEGDYPAARGFYEQALQKASQTTARHIVLFSKVNLAKVAVKEGRSQAALNGLETAARESDALGLKFASIECSIHRAEALINLKDYARARKELETALRKGESIGLRGLLVPAHYMLANVLSVTGNKVEASRHSNESFRLLEELHKEARSDALLQRADLKPIYEKLSLVPPKPPV